MRLQRALLLLLVPLLAGCVAHTDLARTAVSFNRAVEEAQNEMLLLNVVRSSLRRPMYITGIQTASGAIEIGVSAGLAFPFGEFRAIGGEGDPNTGSTGVTYTQNPSFDVTVFNTKEFVTGFTTPVEPKLMAYYWDQGWRPALLLHLLAEHIKITWPGGKETTVFDNYPDAGDEKLCNHIRFAVLVEHLVANDLSFTSTEEPKPLKPAFSAETLSGQLEALVNAHKEKLEISEDGGHYRFQTTSQKIGVALNNSETVLTKIRQIDKDLKARFCQDQPESLSPSRSASMKTESGKGSVELFLRSPEAILHYLGELVRVETRAENPGIPMACINDRIEPVFVVRTSGCPRSGIAAEYEGDRYFVPERDSTGEACGRKGAANPEHYLAPLSCNGGRSASALTLVDQLINLQKSASDLPAPRLVRTVGN